MSVVFIDPVAACMVEPSPYVLSADLSLPVTVGLVVNKIPQCDVFMGHVADALTAARPAVKTRLFETGKITFADDALTSQIAEACDVAICAIGHCGSCTAGTVKDGIHLIEKGVPAVTLRRNCSGSKVPCRRDRLAGPMRRASSCHIRSGAQTRTP